ncbi:hypothetical protein F2P81_023395 [Scophthalmus maximus]|uniref:Uncharacterized protein n=1 Tax=Scophthalmus maximus TaxID=52904 RepID=A0A6A4RRD8_SCOMX|nr:hypothetical protein F2P81_023395 [Scophthalmus maximus]
MGGLSRKGWCGEAPVTSDSVSELCHGQKPPLIHTDGQISLLHRVQDVQPCINNINNTDNSRDQVLWLKFDNYDNYGSNSGYISETARHAKTTGGNLYK